MEIGISVEVYRERGSCVAEEERGVAIGEDGAGKFFVEFGREDGFSLFVVGCYEAVYFWEGA